MRNYLLQILPKGGCLAVTPHNMVERKGLKVMTCGIMEKILLATLMMTAAPRAGAQDLTTARIQDSTPAWIQSPMYAGAGDSLQYAVPSSLSAREQDSLSFYLQMAIKNNPGLQAKRLEYSAAIEKIPQAGALPDPTVEFGFFPSPMEIMAGNRIADISLMQMFPWFGALKASKDEASQMAVMKMEEARGFRNTMVMQVKISWYNIFKIRKSLVILDENVELLKALEQVALSSYANAVDGGVMSSSSRSAAATAESPKAIGGMQGNDPPVAMKADGMSGMGGMSGGSSSMKTGGMGGMSGGSMSMKSSVSAMTDVLRVQMEIAEMENKLTETQELLIVETARFNSLLNRPPATPVAVPDSIQASSLSGMDMMTGNLSANPMLKMAIAGKNAGHAMQSVASKMGKPMLGLGISYMVVNPREGNMSMMNGRDMIMPMASMSIPFFSKKYGAMEREAGFRTQAAEKVYEETMNELTAAMSEAIGQHRNAGRQLDLYRRQTALTQTAVDLLVTAYSSSSASIDEVLRMQVQLLGLRLQELEALTALNVAEAQIMYITGN